MEEATVAIFWGSILAQYVWLRREAIYNHAKEGITNLAGSIWSTSAKKLKSISSKKSVSFREGEEMSNSNRTFELIEEEVITNTLNQEREQKNQINKEKKIKKERPKKPKNLRKIVRRYEDWLLESRNIRRMANKIGPQSNESGLLPFEFKRDSCEFDENMMNYNVQKLYEEYCQENDEEYNNGTILGYNPFVSDEQQHESEKILYKNTSPSVK